MNRRRDILKYETPKQILIKALVFGFVIGGTVMYAMSKTLKPVPTPATVQEQTNVR